MDELAYASALEIADLIRSGQVSSREAVDATVARIDRLDGPTNLVVTVDAAAARAAADAAADHAVGRRDLSRTEHHPVTV